MTKEKVLQLAMAQLIWLTTQPTEEAFAYLVSLKDATGDILPLPRAKRLFLKLAEEQRQARQAEKQAELDEVTTPITNEDLG